MEDKPETQNSAETPKSSETPKSAETPKSNADNSWHATDLIVKEILCRGMEFETVGDTGLFPTNHPLNPKIITHLERNQFVVPKVELSLDMLYELADKDEINNEEINETPVVLAIECESEKKYVDTCKHIHYIAEITKTYFKNYDYPPQIHFLIIYGTNVKRFNPITISSVNFYFKPDTIFLSEVVEDELFDSLDKKITATIIANLKDCICLANISIMNEKFDFERHKKCLTYLENKVLFPDQEFVEIIKKHMDSKFSKSMTDDQKKQIGRDYMATIIEEATQKGKLDLLLKLLAKHRKKGIPMEQSMEFLDITEDEYLGFVAMLEEKKKVSATS
ncbi:MAG: hypothetical protein LBE27_01380 [Deltaproteobacteria bacterium]|jgi:hypothetical protein|nr:hypothetical protein [Deltaproteobacteria bacterium]